MEAIRQPGAASLQAASHEPVGSGGARGAVCCCLHDCGKVPAKRVRRLLGSGGSLTAERPEEEAFAENVSVLTRKVFGLEVDQSGFCKLLSEEARNADYDVVDAIFGIQIGAEVAPCSALSLINGTDVVTARQSSPAAGPYPCLWSAAF